MKKKPCSLIVLLIFVLTFVLAGIGPAFAGPPSLSTDIKITAPAAGETLTAGSDYTVKFSFPSLFVTGGELYYSPDGGASWSLITDEIAPDDNSYIWEVPGSATNHAKLKLVITKRIFDGFIWKYYYYYNSSEEFKIKVFLTPILLPPAAPSDLSISNIKFTGLDLNWQDNSENESAFIIERKAEGAAAFSELATVAADTNSYTDNGLTSGNKYYYRVKARNIWGFSNYSNEASATTLFFDPHLPILTKPSAPANLLGEAVSSTQIELGWQDTSNNESGFKIDRKISGGTFAEIATVAANTTTFVDTGLNPDINYFYRVKAYNIIGNSDYSNTLSIKTPPAVTPPASSIIMKFYINNINYYVNDTLLSMDAAPIIRDNRTLLPIRYVAQPLGADVDWDNASRRVTIEMNGKIINCWIDNPVATIDGVSTMIDPLNPNVKPIIIPPGRTMLPLRFIAESLGCKVDWNQALSEAMVTYPKP